MASQYTVVFTKNGDEIEEKIIKFRLRERLAILFHRDVCITLVPEVQWSEYIDGLLKDTDGSDEKLSN